MQALRIFGVSFPVGRGKNLTRAGAIVQQIRKFGSEGGACVGGAPDWIHKMTFTFVKKINRKANSLWHIN